MLTKYILPFFAVGVSEYYFFKFLNRNFDGSLLLLLLILCSGTGVVLLFTKGPEFARSLAKGLFKPQSKTSANFLQQRITITAAGLLLFPGLLTGIIGLGLLLPAVQKLITPWLKNRVSHQSSEPNSRRFGLFDDNGVIDVDITKDSKPHSSSKNTELE